MNFFEKTLSQSTCHTGKVFSVQTSKVLLSNNNIASREVAIRKHAACVLAITKSKKAVMVKQFRYAAKKSLLEIPAGKMEDREKNPLLCAKRELLEETGFKSPHWINLGHILPSPGFCNEKIYIFLAKKAFKADQPKPDPNELVEPIIIDFNKLVNATVSGQIVDAKTVCAVLRANTLKTQHILDL